MTARNLQERFASYDELIRTLTELESYFGTTEDQVAMETERNIEDTNRKTFNPGGLLTNWFGKGRSKPLNH